MKPFDISADQNINLIEYAGNTIDKYEMLDSSTPNLTEVCVSKCDLLFFKQKKWDYCNESLNENCIYLQSKILAMFFSF